MKFENFTNQIKEHALRDAPDEACGLIFRRDGVFIAKPYQNSHLPEKERPTAFQIDENDVLEALRSGMLAGIYHSHTNNFADFGMADKAVAEEFDLPSYLYLVPSDTFKVYYPSGKMPPLIGRPYVPLVHDCISVVRDHYKEVLGIDSPDIDRTMDESKHGKKSGIAEYFLSMGFKPVTKARPHDVVLMMIRCHNWPNHVGVITEDGLLLHHMYNGFSRLDPYGSTWERCTSLIFRHPNFLKFSPKLS